MNEGEKLEDVTVLRAALAEVRKDRSELRRLLEASEHECNERRKVIADLTDQLATSRATEKEVEIKLFDTSSLLNLLRNACHWVVSASIEGRQQSVENLKAILARTYREQTLAERPSLLDDYTWEHIEGWTEDAEASERAMGRAPEGPPNRRLKPPLPLGVRIAFTAWWVAVGLFVGKVLL